ncbi:hypothetical protein LCGC14_3107640 [marine sediment metagenome]|uniref:Uncharacterized protein n=1 Tax=marine sediment metagenome TaxID=412755 RepID=A0A0F8W658_9ZZZZ
MKSGQRGTLQLEIVVQQYIMVRLKGLHFKKLVKTLLGCILSLVSTSIKSE